MAIDIYSPFGTDLQFGPGEDITLTGREGVDFEFVREQQEFIQRIIRRLLTAPGEWIPFPKYGAGLRRWVDEPLTSANAFEIETTIMSQIGHEPDLAANPTPVVILESIENGLSVTIKCFTISLQPVSFNFNTGSGVVTVITGLDIA